MRRQKEGDGRECGDPERQKGLDRVKAKAATLPNKDLHGICIMRMAESKANLGQRKRMDADNLDRD